MTKKQFNEINEALIKWGEERGETEAFLDKCYKADYSRFYIGGEI